MSRVSLVFQSLVQDAVEVSVRVRLCPRAPPEAWAAPAGPLLHRGVQLGARGRQTVPVLVRLRLGAGFFRVFPRVTLGALSDPEVIERSEPVRP